MKRPESRDGRGGMSHPHGAWFWAASVCGLFAFMAGCTGKIGAMASGSAGASNPAGTGNSAGSGAGGRADVEEAQAPRARAAPVSAGIRTRSRRRRRPPCWWRRPGWRGSAGSSGRTPCATCSKLTDISDIDSDVSGDALIGFDNEADALFVTEQLRSQLFDASEKLADKVTGDATALGAPRSRERADGHGRQGARRSSPSFGQRAFRRPLTDAEVTTHVGLFNQGPTLYPGVDAFKAGASLVIQAMLQSPYFLYRTELGTAAAGASKVPLNDWEVGAKLALSITNTIPDDTLLAAAAAGQLHDTAGVAAQAKRLLDGSTGTAGLSNFNLQVYRLGTYDGITRDATVFPDFKPNTPAAMKQEVLQFLNWIFTQGRGIKDFYTTPVGLRELAARAALRRDRQLLERPGHADEGRSRSDPAVRSADAGRVPVVVHLGGQRAGHHPPRRVHRGHGSCARRCRRRTPRPSGR